MARLYGADATKYRFAGLGEGADVGAGLAPALFWNFSPGTRDQKNVSEGRGKPYALHRLCLNPAKRVFCGVCAV